MEKSIERQRRSESTITGLRIARRDKSRYGNRCSAPCARFFLFARKSLLIAGGDSIARTETQPGHARRSESNRVKKPRRRRVCRTRKRVPLRAPLLFFHPRSQPELPFDSRRMCFRSGRRREKRPIETQSAASLSDQPRAIGSHIFRGQTGEKPRGENREGTRSRTGRGKCIAPSSLPFPARFQWIDARNSQRSHGESDARG